MSAMKEFKGSAGICVKDNKLLMVLQGTLDEEKLWTVPSGGLEQEETFEQCCIREFHEETGYHVEIKEYLQTKSSTIKDFQVTVKYYLVNIIGGEKTFHDPDNLIHDIQWIDSDKFKKIKLSFEEDREMLLAFINQKKFRQTQ